MTRAQRRLGEGVLVLVAAFAAYAPALRGAFVSDDFYYLWSSPSVASPSWRGIVDILDPFGSSALSILNWAPVHLLLHALEVAVFGRDPLGYHVVNVLVHVAAALLLARLLVRTGADARAAFAAALVFALHPANVEAVAWVSQLKTTSSLALAFVALLALERRPAFATAVFALALLAKAQALAALPFAAAMSWLAARGGSERTGAAAASGSVPPIAYAPRWVAAWAVVGVGYVAVELSIFRAASESIAPLHDDPVLLVANLVAVAGRYAVMIATGTGLATFHQPDAIESLASPWVWGTAIGLALAAARALVAFRSRSPELAWWAFGAAAYAPISQVLPFLHPVGDRYVYYLLPPVLGIALCALRARSIDERRVAAAGVALALVLGVLAHARAGVWASPERVFADSAARYPNGLKAHMGAARAAARRGDGEAACKSLDRARARGFTGLAQLFADPGLRALRGTPCFDAIVRDVARERVAHFAAQRPSQLALANLAFAQRALGDVEQARRTLERAVALGGPMTTSLVRQLRALERGGREAGAAPPSHAPAS
ncbi:MAG: hypothetical protein KC560_05290 [Myxococcales bacterium]|nr:hypothetical protein [Myxococcales bacterium]